MAGALKAAHQPGQAIECALTLRGCLQPDELKSQTGAPAIGRAARRRRLRVAKYGVQNKARGAWAGRKHAAIDGSRLHAVASGDFDAHAAGGQVFELSLPLCVIICRLGIARRACSRWYVWPEPHRDRGPSRWSNSLEDPSLQGLEEIRPL